MLWWEWLTQRGRGRLLLHLEGRGGLDLLELKSGERETLVVAEGRGAGGREDRRVERMPEMGLVTPGSERTLIGAGRGQPG